MMIFIANKKSFYEISEQIPMLLKHWSEKGIKASEQEAIDAIMKDCRCTHLIKADKFDDETAELILAARRG